MRRGTLGSAALRVQAIAGDPNGLPRRWRRRPPVARLTPSCPPPEARGTSVAAARSCGSPSGDQARAPGVERTPSLSPQAEAKTSRCRDGPMWFCGRPFCDEPGSGMERAAPEVPRGGGCRTASAMAPAPAEPRMRRARSVDPSEAARTPPAKGPNGPAWGRTDAGGSREREPPHGGADRRGGETGHDQKRGKGHRRQRLRQLGTDLRPGVRAGFPAWARRGRPGRRAAGGSVLEVGVGTGLSLASYFVPVLRPGGEIVITIRVSAGTGLRGRLERWLMSSTTRLGWRSEFPWDRYARWAEGWPAVRLLERRPIPPLVLSALAPKLTPHHGTNQAGRRFRRASKAFGEVVIAPAGVPARSRRGTRPPHPATGLNPGVGCRPPSRWHRPPRARAA